MNNLKNYRWWAFCVLFAGCFYAFMMLCDEAENAVGEFIAIRIMAIALLLGYGYPLCRMMKNGNAKSEPKSK